MKPCKCKKRRCDSKRETVIDSFFLSAVSKVLKDFDLDIGRDAEIDMANREVNITADLSFEKSTEIAHALEDAVGQCCE